LTQTQTIVIENRRPALIGPPLISLHPGENDIPVEQWDKFRERPIGKMLLKAGWIKPRPDVRKATPLVENLSVVEQSKALELIQTCKSQELLHRWARNDSRSKSQVAIQRRLDSFAVPSTLEEQAAETVDSAVADAGGKGKPASKG